MAKNVDLRLASYDTARGKMVTITFYNDADAILDIEYCNLEIVESRLYFNAGTKNDIRLSNHKLQIHKIAPMLDDFVGEYFLEWDKDRLSYFIDINNSKSIDIDVGLQRGIPKLGYTAHDGKVIDDDNKPKATIKPAVKDMIIKGKLDNKRTQVETLLLGLLFDQVDGDDLNGAKSTVVALRAIMG